MEGYSAEIEQKMQRFFGWLSEKDRRRYAAIEAAKLGHGGVEYIARVLGCDPQTIRQGLRAREGAKGVRARGPSAKRGWPPAGRRRTADPRNEPPPLVAGVHRWGSDACRRTVD